MKFIIFSKFDDYDTICKFSLFWLQTAFRLMGIFVICTASGIVIVSVFASSAVDHGFEPWSGQMKDYKIGICCFSTKHTALRRKSKDGLAQYQDNVSECGDISIHGLLFQWASTCHYKNPTRCVGLVQSGPHHHLIENKLVLAMI